MRAMGALKSLVGRATPSLFQIPRTLIGDIADDPEGKPALHIHIVLGTRDGSAKAGHLGEGHVRPTLEVVVSESPAHLRKVRDTETGLALIRPAA